MPNSLVRQGFWDVCEIQDFLCSESFQKADDGNMLSSDVARVPEWFVVSRINFLQHPYELCTYPTAEIERSSRRSLVRRPIA